MADPEPGSAKKVLLKNYGEMSEWLKEHAWKACVLQKGTVGSNPTLSADTELRLAEQALFIIH